MVMNGQLEQDTNNNSRSELNTSSFDELASVSALTSRGAVEVFIIQTLHRVIEPILEPLVRRVVKEEIGLAQQKLLTSMAENMNPSNKADTSTPKILKLQFRNKISLPVLSGEKLLGENQTPIEIALVDALTEQIVSTGTESTAKLEIVVLQEGDDDSDVDCWTFENEDFESKIVRERKGKPILKGNTYLHLKEGIGFIDISFTHNKDWTPNGKYRLGARAVDTALMTRVAGAWTEAFLIRDKRKIYHEKHYPPTLGDRPCHLKQISAKGVYYKRLKEAKVNTVKDFLTIFRKNPKRLEDILDLKASSKIWDDMVSHALTCEGLFLYLDPSCEQKTGVVFNVKQQLKGLIQGAHYIPVDQLSQKQMMDSQNFVKYVSEHIEALESFEDETSLKEFLGSDISFSVSPSANQSLGSSMMADVLLSPLPLVTYSSPDNLGNLNLHTNQSHEYAPMVTVPSETEPTSFANCYQPDTSFHPHSLESPYEMDFGSLTERHPHDPSEPGTSVFNQSLDVEEYYRQFLNCDANIEINGQWASEPPDFGTNGVTVAVMVCSTNAQTRWTKVSKLLRRLSVRERIVQAQKRQRCC